MNKPFVLLWAAVVVMILFFWVYFPSLSRYRELKLEEETMERQIREYDAQIQSLTEERELLKNDKGHIEKVIREELGLVRPGEIVYKFVPEAAAPAPAPDAVQVSPPQAVPADLPADSKAELPVAPKKDSSPEAEGGVVVPAREVTPLKSAAGRAAQAQLSLPVASAHRLSSEPSYPRQETR